MGGFLKYDHLFAFASGGVWISLTFWDLKKDGRLNAGWMKAFGMMEAVAVDWTWCSGDVGLGRGESARKEVQKA